MNRICIISVALLVLTVGCASTPTPGKLTRQSPAPPAYPAARPDPIDPALRAAALAEIENASNSNDEYIRAHTMEAIRQSIGVEGRRTILKGLSDPSPLVRFSAAVAAGELCLPEAREPLLSLVDDNDLTVRLGVKFALHRLGDKRFSHDFEKTARDPDPSIRANTAMVLGLIGEPSAAKILRYLLNDRYPIVHLQAAESLWRLGESDGLEALVSASISRYPDDQMVAALALAAPRDRRIIAHVRGLLVTDYPEINLVAARAMGLLGSDEGYGSVLLGAQSSDPRQQLLAALAFGAIARTDSQQPLSKLLASSTSDVRLAAATSILQLKAP